jgi:hypothetical protein
MKLVAFVRQAHNAKLDFALLTLLTQQLPNIVTSKMDILALQTLHVSQVHALHQEHQKLCTANLKTLVRLARATSSVARNRYAQTPFAHGFITEKVAPATTSVLAITATRVPAR